MYFALIIDIPEEASELAQAVLHGAGALGLELQEAGLIRPPGEPEPNRGRVGVIAYFEGDLAAGEARRQLLQELPEARADFLPVKEEDWSQAWKSHVRPVRVGRLWVGPSWMTEDAGDAPFKVVIDPGMAFGTGDHPTTQHCLKVLDDEMSGRAGLSVLDVGTGSGVLALAAKRLGAERVAAIDIDPMAIEVARENAERNGIQGVDFSTDGVEKVQGHFDIVVANIFSQALIDLAQPIAERVKPGGILALTGILTSQASDVAQAYKDQGLAMKAQRNTAEWVLLTFARK